LEDEGVRRLISDVDDAVGILIMSGGNGAQLAVLERPRGCGAILGRPTLSTGIEE
jgi:hypothetical protein